MARALTLIGESIRSTDVAAKAQETPLTPIQSTARIPPSTVRAESAPLGHNAAQESTGASTPISPKALTKNVRLAPLLSLVNLDRSPQHTRVMYSVPAMDMDEWPEGKLLMLIPCAQTPEKRRRRNGFEEGRSWNRTRSDLHKARTHRCETARGSCVVTAKMRIPTSRKRWRVHESEINSSWKIS